MRKGGTLVWESLAGLTKTISSFLDWELFFIALDAGVFLFETLLLMDFFIADLRDFFCRFIAWNSFYFALRARRNPTAPRE